MKCVNYVEKEIPRVHSDLELLLARNYALKLPQKEIVGECIGAKGSPRCVCQGDELYCDFYADKRERASKENKEIQELAECLQSCQTVIVDGYPRKANVLEIAKSLISLGYKKETK